LNKQEIYNNELKKLNDIFADVEESKRKLVEGLILDAAFLKAENYTLKETLKATGMIKINPKDRTLQKKVLAADQYLKNVNTYATVIKSLNSVLSKNIIEEDDGFDDWIKEQNGSD